MEGFTQNAEILFEECETFVRMDAATRKILEAIEEMPNIYEEFPGFVGLGMVAGHNSPKFLAACDRFANTFYPQIPNLFRRLEQAENYLNRTAPGLSRGGKTNGYLINALIAASRPQDFRPEQRQIWGDPGYYIPLLLPIKGIVKFLNISAQIDLSIPGANTKSCAHNMLILSQESGSPDANGFSALLAAAIEGTLTSENCVQTFKALRREAADPSAAAQASLNALRRLTQISAAGIPLDAVTKMTQNAGAALNNMIKIPN
ncbi:hypothetical protein HZC21_01885 [Candidatus Peregrinibacteria bacterium]|nr:hypothetical protein [Candidatus Peregrinibacteria bacterium]